MHAKVFAIVGVTVAASLAFAAGPAEKNSCFEACVSDFRTERTQAESAFTDALKLVTVDVQTCLNGVQGATASFACIRQGRVQTVNLEQDFRRAMALVSTDLNDCSSACAPKVQIQTESSGTTPTP